MTGDQLVNADTGEIIAECTPAEARELTDRINTAIGATWDLIITAYRNRAWAALGHASWDAYTAAEFPHHQLRLPREERDEVIESLRTAGLSIRAIAATGVASKNTVDRVIAASGVPNGDTCVVGVDGKTYATPGLAARAQRLAEEAAQSSDTPPPAVSDEPQDPAPGPAAHTPPEQNATPEPHAAPVDDAAPASDGEVGSPPGLPVTDLPGDWRDRIAHATHLLSIPAALVAAHATGDDRADLADLAIWIEAFHQATEEQA